MTYLVTGGAGFIGSHIARQLLARGEIVIIYDNFNDYYDSRIKRANVANLAQQYEFILIDGDVRDVDALSTVFKQHPISHIAHMAAMAGVRSSVMQVLDYVQVNIVGSTNILEMANQFKVQQVVLASTSSVYGKTKHLPFVETDVADRPLSAYPATKRAMELLAHTYHNLHGMNISILRFFNVYGPAGRPDMMPMRLLQAAFDGTEIPLFDGGRFSRDWTYIDDIVTGVVASLDKPLGYQVMNLGRGEPITMTAFIAIIEELTHRRIRTKATLAPLSEPHITYCDNSKVRDLLGFAPSTSIQDGLFQTWNWFRNHYNIS